MSVESTEKFSGGLGAGGGGVAAAVALSPLVLWGLELGRHVGVVVIAGSSVVGGGVGYGVGVGVGVVVVIVVVVSAAFLFVLNAGVVANNACRVRGRALE